VKIRKADLVMFFYFFILFFIIYGVGLPILLLIGVPLIQWLIHGFLDFSPRGAGLIGLFWLVMGMTLISAVFLWVEGKIHKRW